MEHPPLLPQKIVVLLGGSSPEREISLQSGTAVAAAMRQRGHEVTLLDPAETTLSDFDWPLHSIAVIMLHGTGGEDGLVQSELAALGVCYTGSDAFASRLAFHKIDSKKFFRTTGLNTPDWEVLTSDATRAEVESAAARIGFPLVLKPDAQGSSIGVSIVARPTELWDAFELARALDERILIERVIPGEEWTVPILDSFILPAIRISSKRTFFDYSAKYLDDQTRYEVLDAETSETARVVSQLSLEACRVLGTHGVCRVDLIVDHSGIAWLLEVNTIPGMTNHSLVPKAAAVLGWSLPDLCERILFSALANRCK